MIKSYKKFVYKIYNIFLTALLIIGLSSCQKQTGYDTNKSVMEGVFDFYKNDMVNSYKQHATDKLRVALLVPLSGPIKPVGESILNVAQMSMFDNKKSNMILRVYDTNGTTFGAVKAMKEAIKNGVDVVAGPLFMSETKAIQSLAKNNGILVFSLSNEQELLNYDNVFVTGSIVEQEIQTLITYMMENDTYNYVALMPNTSFGATLNKVLREIITGKDGLLIKIDFYEHNDKNLMKKINELISFYEIPKTLYDNFEKKKLEQKLSGSKEELEFKVSDEEKIYPHSIFIAEGGKNAEQIANLLFVLQKGDKKIQLIGTTKLDGDDNMLFNPYLNGTIFVGANPKKYKKFSKNYYEMYRSKPIKITSMVYDLINILDLVYDRVDNIYIPNKINLLNPYGFDGIDGRFRFLPNGLVERKLHVLQFKDGEKIVLDTNQEFLNY